MVGPRATISPTVSGVGTCLPSSSIMLISMFISGGPQEPAFSSACSAGKDVDMPHNSVIPQRCGILAPRSA